jgi:hypothetical protein
LRVVIKIVSPHITHKTEAGGVAFVPNAPEAVQAAVRDMDTTVRRLEAPISGVLLCACVERESDALGHELLVGLRISREFGPVVTAGLGGTATETLAQSMNAGRSAVTASAVLSSPERFMALFRTTLAYSLLAGEVRGRRRAIDDEQLLRCFEGLFELARRFSFERPAGAAQSTRCW